MLENTVWHELLKDEMKKDYFLNLIENVDRAYDEGVVYPPKEAVFRAFELTDYEDVKVVILGQDPYHGYGQAEGLSFSVKEGVKVPPSLVNMYKELADDMGCEMPTSGSLVKWAKDGVLLLNTVLTVPEKNANGHKGIGWETFTDAVICELNSRKTPVVFILWGKPSQKKSKLITNPWHHIIEGPHPSPLSSYRGFFGSKPYSRANAFLVSVGQAPVDWCAISPEQSQMRLEMEVD
ncbi:MULTISPECIES: uracil-DNA glycosylase [unclassified Fusibacter]|uniref:uracil-DNA glycosylase n=1 Tax=unclassified Fusibacter TaxID=2624464 RepID=UPI0010122ECB|nr:MULTISPECIES: uracil-DNA glycosylase [unclassified Fusibacter]MCK8059384.1 uracil-DNA glycosylase [Fusibacter sp. A2]NPE21152.1 uracil-DNA glycosylase [Fusibacter sp. A1]RXV62420.1 uracil-DNA glycosylase [Fusibacter sp. A1]